MKGLLMAVALVAVVPTAMAAPSAACDATAETWSTASTTGIAWLQATDPYPVFGKARAVNALGDSDADCASGQAAQCDTIAAAPGVHAGMETGTVSLTDQNASAECVSVAVTDVGGAHARLDHADVVLSQYRCVSHVDAAANAGGVDDHYDVTATCGRP